MRVTNTNWGFQIRAAPEEAALFANATLAGLGALHREATMLYYDHIGKRSVTEVLPLHLRVNALTGYIGRFLAAHRLAVEPCHCGTLSCCLPGHYEVVLGVEEKYMESLQSVILQVLARRLAQV